MTEFSSLPLKQELINACTALGFERPTPIQARAIPALIESSGDLVALAGTGTGKTAAFGLPMLHKLDPKSRTIQALVLSPTRELCCQISADLKNFAKELPGVRIVPVYGGASMGTQIRDLKRNPQIVVATPGRLIDHLERGNIDLTNLATLVLDEADEMLSMGFREELETIIAGTSGEKQTCLFSATMPRDIRSIINSYLNDPREISVPKEHQDTGKVEHHYCMVKQHERFETLSRFIARHSDMYGIVFCRTKDQTREIADKLGEAGFAAEAIHGDLSQQQRDYVMQRFRNRIVKILVATDVAARGIDVNDLSHVIHYELPHNAESYVHRSGRTGRAGKEGTSVAIVTPKDGYKVRSLGKRINSEVKKMNVPTGNEILAYHISEFVEEIKSPTPIGDHEREHFSNALEALNELSKEELIERILYSRFGEQIEYYRSRQDIKGHSEDSGRRGKYDRNDRYDRNERGDRNRGDRGNSRRGNNPRERRDRGGFDDSRNVDFARVMFPMGSKDGLRKGDLIGLANKVMKGKQFPVGKVMLKTNSATIEVPRDMSAELAKRLDGKVVKEKKKTA